MMSRIESVAIARSFIGTPYHLHGRLKGVGVDCATLLCEFLIEIGAAQEKDFVALGFYASDWFCHDKSNRYLAWAMRHAKLAAETVARPGIKEALPGCIALFQVVKSPVFNHGAVITEWPMGVHAQADGVKEVNLSTHRLTGFTKMDLFDPFGAR
jgi:hypothetical protein